MPNRNYLRGRAKEYREAAKLKAEGWTVLRTAGSHGFADLVAVKSVQETGVYGEIRFIQVKKGKLSESERAALTRFLQTFNGVYRVSGELRD